MVCPICKNTVSETAKICPRCGKTIMEIPGYSIPEEKIVVRNVMSQNNKKNSRIKRFFEEKEPKTVSAGIIILGLLFCFTVFCVKNAIKSHLSDDLMDNSRERVEEGNEIEWRETYRQYSEGDSDFFDDYEHWEVDNSSSYWGGEANELGTEETTVKGDETKVVENDEIKVVFQNYRKYDIVDGIYVISSEKEDRAVWIYQEEYHNEKRLIINYAILEDDHVSRFVCRGMYADVDNGLFSIADVTNNGDGTGSNGQNFQYGYIDDNIVITEDAGEILAGTYTKRDDLIIHVYGDYGWVFRDKGIYMWKSEPIEYLVTEADIDEIKKPENVGKIFSVDAEMLYGGTDRLSYKKGGYQFRLNKNFSAKNKFYGIGYVKETPVKDGTMVTYVARYMGVSQDLLDSIYGDDIAVFETIDIIVKQE